MITIKIPTIADNTSSFYTLFLILESIKQCKQSIKFEFTSCKFLGQNAVAFLGGVIRLVENQGDKVIIDRTTLSGDVAKNLAKNGFSNTFLGETSPISQGNTIPFREDFAWENTEMIGYLKSMWLRKGKFHISDNLSDAIASKVSEIYLNSFEHRHSKIGVFSCGQHYPKLQQLSLTVVDFGVGIPGNVRNYFNRPDIKSSKALAWAIEEGNSTDSNIYARGLGLGILKNFVKKNNGCLEIFSLDGYVKISKDNVFFKDINTFFQGTLINIRLECDEKHYFFSSESKPKFSN